MIETTATVRIDRAPEDVFDYWTDMSNDPDWNPYARSSTRTSEAPLGVGTTFEVVRKGSGRNEILYTEYERPSRWAITGTGRGVAYTFEARIAPADGGSEITSTMRLEQKGAARLVSPAVRFLVARQMKDVHTMLKRKLETPEKTGPPAES